MYGRQIRMKLLIICTSSGQIRSRQCAIMGSAHLDCGHFNVSKLSMCVSNRRSACASSLLLIEKFRIPHENNGALSLCG